MKRTSIILNGKQEVTCFGIIKEVISSLLSIPMSHTYSGVETIKDNFITCCDLVIEFCEIMRPDKTDPDSKKIKTELTRTITKMSKLKGLVTKYDDKEQVEKFIYDVILSFEGNGRLSGFMMSSKHKDLIKKNPEIHSVSEIAPTNDRFLQRKIYVTKKETDSQTVL